MITMRQLRCLLLGHKWGRATLAQARVMYGGGAVEVRDLVKQCKRCGAWRYA